MKNSRILSWESLTETAMPSVGGTVLRRFISGEQLTFARVAFEAGAAVAEHEHENEQISFVASGRMEFVIGGVAHTIDAGQMVYLPAHVWHGAKALEESVVLDLFSPPRVDWESQD